MGDDGGCLKNVLFGCGAAVLLCVVGVVFLTVSIIGPMRAASQAREELEGNFATEEAFQPPASGVIPAERIERFIAVRRQLTASCLAITEVEEQMARMEAFDEQEEVSRSEVMKQAFKTSRAAMGMGKKLGEYFAARNQALLVHEMGLGEFSYLFAVAYAAQLADDSVERVVFDGPAVNSRMRRALAAMLERQLAAAREQELSPEWLETLESELVRVTDETGRIPWQDGLPTPLEQSLAPSRAELDELYCEALAPLELLKNRRRALAYETY